MDGLGVGRQFKEGTAAAFFSNDRSLPVFKPKKRGTKRASLVESDVFGQRAEGGEDVDTLVRQTERERMKVKGEGNGDDCMRLCSALLCSAVLCI